MNQTPTTANNKALEEVIKKFNGEPANFTPQQVAYISGMFSKKGPVLVRIGVKKQTRFLGSEEWDEEKQNYCLL